MKQLDDLYFQAKERLENLNPDMECYIDIQNNLEWFITYIDLAKNELKKANQHPTHLAYWIKHKRIELYGQIYFVDYCKRVFEDGSNEIEICEIYDFQMERTDVPKTYEIKIEQLLNTL